jgi:hypothetical protein
VSRTPGVIEAGFQPKRDFYMDTTEAFQMLSSLEFAVGLMAGGVAGYLIAIMVCISNNRGRE